MLIIGLTGGIGSGKSTVADYFAQQGTPVIDGDQLARELVAPGSPALGEIARSFGLNILQPDGTLNRPQLRRRVFADPSQRRRLEAILHPRIYAEMHRRTQELRAPYCIWVIPLLLETGQTALVDRVLVVDTPESLQRERVLSRDGVDQDTLEAILRSQASRPERLRAADDVIVNNADLAHLQQQVTALHHRYLGLARAAPPRQKND
jgi:dephospho-CoA kinase